MEKAAAGVVLHSYWRSSCSYRVRIALNWKDIPYQYKAVSLLAGDQAKEEYAKLNTMKIVPTLEIDDNVLVQSVAIMEYLEETRPEPPLLPPRDQPLERTKVRQIVQLVCADIQPVQNLRVLKMLGDERKTEWAKHWITVGFQGLEKLLEKTAGKYCVGDQVTMADCCLVPQVYNAKRFAIDLSLYPTISRVNTELQQLPAFQAADPANQPDAEK